MCVAAQPIEFGAAQNSKLGNGGAAHREVGGSGFIDHGHQALFDLPTFLSFGGYDETFSHNEDAEFDYRLARAGGKIWLCSEAVANYFPRLTPLALAKQYFGHGQGRAQTILKHKARHNPALNLFRKMTPHLRTPDEHPLMMSDLQLARTGFRSIE